MSPGALPPRSRRISTAYPVGQLNDGFMMVGLGRSGSGGEGEGGRPHTLNPKYSTPNPNSSTVNREP